MVITKEVPRPSWRRVLDDLSRVHAGATAHLVVLDDEQGPQTHGDAFALVGMSSDGDAGTESIAAILIRGGAHVTHIIDRPRSLHVELLWESRTANLQIADASGIRTLICLGPPVLAGRTPPAATAPRHRNAERSAALVKIPVGG
jgi:hypothetical protein